MLFELVKIPVQVRIAEIIVKDDDREINVRVRLVLIGVVLPNTGCIPQFVCIGRERVPVEEANVVRLFRRSMLDTAPPTVTDSEADKSGTIGPVSHPPRFGLAGVK